MKNLSKNLIRATLSAALCTSLLACGSGGNRATPTINNVPSATSAKPVTTPPASAAQLGDLSQLPAAQVNALTGTYDGTYQAYDQDYNLQNLKYTLTLVPNSVSGQPGRAFQVTFQAGDHGQYVFSAFAKSTRTSSVYGGNSIYTITTLAQNAPSISQNGLTVLSLSLVVTANNLLDPTSSQVRLGTYDGVLLQDVVTFNNDLQKR